LLAPAATVYLKYLLEYLLEYSIDHRMTNRPVMRYGF